MQYSTVKDLIKCPFKIMKALIFYPNAEIKIVNFKVYIGQWRLKVVHNKADGTSEEIEDVKINFINKNNFFRNLIKGRAKC